MFKWMIMYNKKLFQNSQEVWWWVQVKDKRSNFYFLSARMFWYALIDWHINENMHDVPDFAISADIEKGHLVEMERNSPWNI